MESDKNKLHFYCRENIKIIYTNNNAILLLRERSIIWDWQTVIKKNWKNVFRLLTVLFQSCSALSYLYREEKQKKIYLKCVVLITKAMAITKLYPCCYSIVKIGIQAIPVSKGLRQRLLSFKYS